MTLVATILLLILGSNVLTLLHLKENLSQLNEAIVQQETTIHELQNSLDLIIKDSQAKDEQIKELKDKLDKVSARQEKTLNGSRITVAEPNLGVSSCEQYRQLISVYFPVSQVNNAVKVCGLESGGDPQAANLTDNHGSCKGSFGLFQINCHNGRLYDVEANIKKAGEMFAKSSWRPWTTARRLGIVG